MSTDHEIAELNQKIKLLEQDLDQERKTGNRLQETIKNLTTRNGYLLTLNDLTTGLVNRIKLDRLLETIVQHACTLTKTPHGFMHLMDNDTGELVFKIGVGSFEKAVGMRIKSDSGMAGVALSRQEAFWVKDYTRWEGRIENKAFKRLRACIVIPLQNRTGTIGLGRFDSDDRPFSMTEVAMLRRFSHMASICIQNATLYQDLEKELAQRKLAEKTLKLSEEEFFSIFDSIQVGFYRTDAQGRVTMANPAAIQMLGYASQEDAMGMSMIDLYKNPEDRDILLEKIFSQGRVSAYEVEMRRQDGQIISVLVNAHVRHNEAGEFIGIQGTVVDISHRKEEEAQNVHSQKLAAIGSLAAGIAHEINTPVQYVSDNTSFIKDAFEDLNHVLDTGTALFDAVGQDKEIDPGIKQAALDFEIALEDADLNYLKEEIPLAVTQSLDGLSRVSRIVRSMKEFSHSSGDQWEPADINHTLENTLTVAKNEWKYLARIRRNFQMDLPLVSCNPGELSQVFLNMIINAGHAIAEYTDSTDGEKGVITIQTRSISSGVEIRISDTGAGIPEEVQDQIFNPFFTTKAVGKGSGQGLSIAHSVVVDRHKGKILFETEPGQGTTFIIQLPVSKIENPGS